MKPRNNPEISPVSSSELMAQFKAAIEARRQKVEREATEKSLWEKFMAATDQPDSTFLLLARQYQSALADHKAKYQEYPAPDSTLMHSFSSLIGRRIAVQTINPLHPSIELQQLGSEGYTIKKVVPSAEGLLSRHNVVAAYTDDHNLYIDTGSRVSNRRYATPLFTSELEPIVTLDIY